jgi:predicted nucleotidyltransferase
MRITREMMLKAASDAVARQARSARGLLAAYLCGSLLEDDYLLGGAGDIDLVYVYTEPVSIPREIVRLTDEVHLDIAHYYQKDYRDTRALREHPWMGPALNSCRILYDPQHFMDFTQASVRGQFDRSDHVYQRARQQLDQARSIWLGYQMSLAHPQPEDIQAYLRALGYAANTIAGISGPPLTDRRLLLQFADRAEAAGQPGLYAGLLGLLGSSNMPEAALKAWLPHWRAAYHSVPEGKAPARLHPARLAYYANALAAADAGPHPETTLWLLLRTWTMAAGFCPAESPERRAWHQACDQLDLVGPAFAERIQALDAYLDGIEETLEVWGRANGVWEG